MNKSRYFFFFVVLSAVASLQPMMAQSLSQRASQFYQRHEWPSALAAYETMFHENPGVAENYIRATVAALMQNNKERAMKIGSIALDHHISIDSLFTGVRNQTITLEQNSMYEAYLIEMKREHSWLSRSVDQYLLSYYVFRDNPAMIVKTANELLKHSPDNIVFLEALAQGYLKGGDISGSMKVYENILEKDSENLTALLYLANYYYDGWNSGEKSMYGKAVDYVKRASQIELTPRLSTMLKTLGS